jgi:hypothetical protein
MNMPCLYIVSSSLLFSLFLLINYNRGDYECCAMPHTLRQRPGGRVYWPRTAQAKAFAQMG